MLTIAEIVKLHHEVGPALLVDDSGFVYVVCLLS